MRFSLNLTEIYHNMANEYDEPLEDYISYEEFVEKLLKGEIKFKVVSDGICDFLVVELR